MAFLASKLGAGYLAFVVKCIPGVTAAWVMAGYLAFVVKCLTASPGLNDILESTMEILWSQ